MFPGRLSPRLFILRVPYRWMRIAVVSYLSTDTKVLKLNVFFLFTIRLFYVRSNIDGQPAFSTARTENRKLTKEHNNKCARENREAVVESVKDSPMDTSSYTLYSRLFYVCWIRRLYGNLKKNDFEKRSFSNWLWDQAGIDYLSTQTFFKCCLKLTCHGSHDTIRLFYVRSSIDGQPAFSTGMFNDVWVATVSIADSVVNADNGRRKMFYLFRNKKF